LKITVNGEARITEAKSLDGLCRELGLSDAKIATARNGAFVPAGQRGAAALVEGDAIEIVSPRQGG
jgi:sulfur carrier protein